MRLQAGLRRQKKRLKGIQAPSRHHVQFLYTNYKAISTSKNAHCKNTQSLSSTSRMLRQRFAKYKAESAIPFEAARYVQKQQRIAANRQSSHYQIHKRHLEQGKYERWVSYRTACVLGRVEKAEFLVVGGIPREITRLRLAC